jgi:hypothetical protein
MIPAGIIPPSNSSDAAVLPQHPRELNDVFITAYDTDSKVSE